MSSGPLNDVAQTGFLGGWIVLQLIRRGEDPKRIRVLDINPPTRPDLTEGPPKDVGFFQVDISDSESVDKAFKAPWPQSGSDADTTIFHTASNIRFYERFDFLLHLSARVNVDGTRHIIKSAKDIGANVLVYTSSGSIGIRRSRFWLWPWEKEPPYFVQMINDDDNLLPTRPELFFSNYPRTKIAAEKLVRAADDTPTGSNGERMMRTGCIRPGNGVYGPGGDILCGAYLVRKVNPTWIPNILENFCYVENCAMSHLV